MKWNISGCFQRSALAPEYLQRDRYVKTVSSFSKSYLPGFPRVLSHPGPQPAVLPGHRRGACRVLQLPAQRPTLRSDQLLPRDPTRCQLCRSVQVRFQQLLHPAHNHGWHNHRLWGDKAEYNRSIKPSNVNHHRGRWPRGFLGDGRSRQRRRAAEVGFPGCPARYCAVRRAEEVCPRQRELEQGEACEGGAGRDPRPAALLHEEQRVPASTTCSSRSMETTLVGESTYKSVECMFCKPLLIHSSEFFELQQDACLILSPFI